LKLTSREHNLGYGISAGKEVIWICELITLSHFHLEILLKKKQNDPSLASWQQKPQAAPWDVMAKRT
jgi:hypothetical protein